MDVAERAYLGDGYEQAAGVLATVKHDGVVKLAVKPGQKVAKGDFLVSIEAMKMATMIRAERDAVVTHTHVKPGDIIAAEDLLVEFQI